MAAIYPVGWEGASEEILALGTVTNAKESDPWGNYLFLFPNQKERCGGHGPGYLPSQPLICYCYGALSLADQSVDP